MRSWTLAAFLVLAACGFSKSLVESGPDTTVTIVDDTFEDGMVVDGAFTGIGIEPDGFVLGGLRARGFQSVLLDPGDDFAKLYADASGATEAGAAYAQVPSDWVLDRPHGVGLGSSTNFTVLYDGEILLPKGMLTLEVDADDRAIVQIAPDSWDPTTFGDLLVDSTSTTGAITFSVDEAGWYPIRAALSEDTGNARMLLTIVQGAQRTKVDASRLRSRVTKHTGVLVYTFDGQGFVGANGHAAVPTIVDDFGAAAPHYDLTASFDRFSLRFAGQLRIETPGQYTFGANIGTDAGDGYRVWIDGKVIAHVWLGHPVVNAGAVMLDAGWHTIVVDYADDIANAVIKVAMQGPDSPGGGPILTDRLRPVVVHGNTFTFAQSNSASITDNTMTLVPLPLEGSPLTLIDAVDIGFRIGNQDMNTLSATLFDCNGAKPLALGNALGYFYYPADTGCAGKTTNPASDWTLRFTDSAPGNGFFIGSGFVDDYGVSALYHGGPNMPFSPLITYTSGARQTPGAIRVDSITALGDFDDAAVEISVRTGADAASLVAAPWVVVRDGIQYEANDLTQYRITITTNGWQYPVLDKVEIVYVVAGE